MCTFFCCFFNRKMSIKSYRLMEHCKAKNKIKSNEKMKNKKKDVRESVQLYINMLFFPLEHSKIKMKLYQVHFALIGFFFIHNFIYRASMKIEFHIELSRSLSLSLSMCLCKCAHVHVCVCVRVWTNVCLSRRATENYMLRWSEEAKEGKIKYNSFGSWCCWRHCTPLCTVSDGGFLWMCFPSFPNRRRISESKGAMFSSTNKLCQTYTYHTYTYRST